MSMKNAAEFIKSFISRVKTAREHPESPESFRALFERFKEALEGNNRSLEIITDIGEKLGGDYLFDIVYIRNAYSELREEIGESIRNFDLLTGNRYPGLRAAFDRIDNLIGKMAYEAPSLSAEPVIFFEDIDWDLFHEVGGKNAHLAEIKKHLNLAVPYAFAVTTHAFDEFIRHNGLREKIDAALKDKTAAESKLQLLQQEIIRGDIPPDLDKALRRAVDEVRAKAGDCFLAVRSSAEEEDGGFSFAGQFETILNVPLDSAAIEEAYKKVIASLFSAKAVAYQRQLAYKPGDMKMAACCMVMVDAAVSGVIYSSNPNGDRDTLVISAAWGLGKSVVEGEADADLYFVRKGAAAELVDARYGKKSFMIVSSKKGGTVEVRTGDDLESGPCLTPAQISELSLLTMRIEKYFGSARDIEWAIAKDGTPYILQARPMFVANDGEKLFPAHEPLDDSGYPILFRDSGTVVQKGAGAGRVFVLRQMDELDNFPKNAVLAARHDSSLFVKIMPFVSAIITETGTPTSHMAALCRELRVPTIVNAGAVLRTLRHGQEVTVYAGDDNATAVYDGIIRDMLEVDRRGSAGMEGIHEFRKKRYILRFVSPLNLIDPLMDEFTPERCKSMHDILRFIHEKAVAQLVENARREGTRLRGHGNVVRLDIPVPAGILAMDMGGGLDVHPGDKKATFEQITSGPLRAVVKGMIHPGVWQSEAVSLRVNDFISSMMRMPDIVSDSESYAGYNVAVISRDYLNLSLRFGYHFNMLDCYLSDISRNNHIYFRFVGGATDIVKRSRRVDLIAAVLRKYGFNIMTKGDFIVARLTNIGRAEMEDILDRIGRLIAYTRQLDALLHSDGDVEGYVEKFLKEDYKF